MRSVDSNKRTTLVLSASYLPAGFFTARAGMRHLIKGTGRALDKHGNLHDWDSWQENSSAYWNDSICLRTRTHAFCIPTIIVLTRMFGVKQRNNNKTVSLRSLYKIYRGTCQYCLEKIPFSQATKDHVYPKSKGGCNDDFNLVLSCKKCNSHKGDAYPYQDVSGKEVKPIRMNSFHRLLSDENLNDRPEWLQFLMKN